MDTIPYSCQTPSGHPMEKERHTHSTCQALVPSTTQNIPSCRPHQEEGYFCHEHQTSHRKCRWTHWHLLHVSSAQRMQSCCDTWRQLPCHPSLLQAARHTKHVLTLPPLPRNRDLTGHSAHTRAHTHAHTHTHRHTHACTHTHTHTHTHTSG